MTSALLALATTEHVLFFVIALHLCQNERILNEKTRLGWCFWTGVLVRPCCFSLSKWASLTPHSFPPPGLLLHLTRCLLLGPLPLVTADSWWAEQCLLEYLRSADPTDLHVRLIILVLKLALRQPGSWGWLVSLAWRLSSWGSLFALADGEACVLGGLGMVCTGMHPLACLALWQERTEGVVRFWWWKESLVGEKVWGRKQFYWGWRHLSQPWSQMLPHVHTRQLPNITWLWSAGV